MTRGDEKTKRVMTAFEHHEPDRLPTAEWFSAEFTNSWIKWRKHKLGIEDKDISRQTTAWGAEVSNNADLDPNKVYDLDMMLVVPNSDPRFITPHVEKTEDYTVYTSGFGCTLKKRNSRLEKGYMAPMPEYIDFPIKTPDDYAKYQFDDPRDPRRFFQPRQDVISGDGFTVLRSYMDEVQNLKENYCLAGGIYEGWEGLWRTRGIENAMKDLVRAPDKVRGFVERMVDFAIENVREQIRLANVPVVYVWGDLGYKTGLLFSPRIWEDIFVPPLRRLIAAIHEANSKVIYHGCGHLPNSTIESLIEAGIDGLNPLEVKAGMSALEIKRKFGDHLTIIGGIDNANVLGTEAGNFDYIRREVLTVFDAARGGGMILQADQAIPGSVPPENYDYFQQLRWNYGNYPISLEKHNQSA